MGKRIILGLILLITGLNLPAQNAWNSKVSDQLISQLHEYEEVECLIQLYDAPDLKRTKRLRTKHQKGRYVLSKLMESAERTQSDITNWLTSEGKPVQKLFIVNVIKTTADLNTIQYLATFPEVKAITTNPKVKLKLPEERSIQSIRSTQWGINQIKADSVWEMGITGQGVVVGGQDTGYEWDHPALKQSYRGYDATLDTAFHDYNWHDAIYEINPLHNDSIPDPANNPCGLQVDAPCDDHRHGTHTMGTMIGLDGDEQIGVAPDAKWCGCRNMERGWGSPFSYLECFQWFLAPTDLNNLNPDPLMAPHVITNSWHCPPEEGCDSTNFELMNIAVRHLKLAGIVVVVSAGNDGPGCSTIKSPAPYFEESFTVGATDERDTIAGFSSRGPVLIDGSGRVKPNVVAPGLRIRSSLLNGTYGNLGGTSMAGPHVAGTVALMISANPALAGQVDTIESILERTASPLLTTQVCDSNYMIEVPNHTYGYGRINAYEAVKEALAMSSSSLNETEVEIAKVFPNPVTNTLYIDSGSFRETFTFRLIDATGSTVIQHQFNTDFRSIHSVDIEHLTPGIFYFNLTANGKTQSGKMIKI